MLSRELIGDMVKDFSCAVCRREMLERCGLATFYMLQSRRSLFHGQTTRPTPDALLEDLSSFTRDGQLHVSNLPQGQIPASFKSFRKPVMVAGRASAFRREFPYLWKEYLVVVGFETDVPRKFREVLKDRINQLSSASPDAIVLVVFYQGWAGFVERNSNKTIASPKQTMILNLQSGKAAIPLRFENIWSENQRHRVKLADPRLTFSYRSGKEDTNVINLSGRVEVEAVCRDNGRHTITETWQFRLNPTESEDLILIDKLLEPARSELLSLENGNRPLLTLFVLSDATKSRGNLAYESLLASWSTGQVIGRRVANTQFDTVMETSEITRLLVSNLVPRE